MWNLTYKNIKFNALLGRILENAALSKDEYILSMLCSNLEIARQTVSPVQCSVS